MTNSLKKDRQIFVTWVDKCNGKNDFIKKCPKYSFKDCSNLGGYDPTDFCR